MLTMKRRFNLYFTKRSLDINIYIFAIYKYIGRKMRKEYGVT
jgi:hypothetical protein